MVADLPPTFSRMIAGDAVKISGRDFQIIASDRHAPEQLMLHYPTENILLSADQVIPGRVAYRPGRQTATAFYAISKRSRSENSSRHSCIAAPSVFLWPARALPTTQQLNNHHMERCGLNGTGLSAKSAFDSRAFISRFPKKTRRATDDLRFQRGACSRQPHAAYETADPRCQRTSNYHVRDSHLIVAILVCNR
jgi:hypothetical protein